MPSVSGSWHHVLEASGSVLLQSTEQNRDSGKGPGLGSSRHLPPGVESQPEELRSHAAGPKHRLGPKEAAQDGEPGWLDVLY